MNFALAREKRRTPWDKAEAEAFLAFPFREEPQGSWETWRIPATLDSFKSPYEFTFIIHLLKLFMRTWCIAKRSLGNL